MITTMIKNSNFNHGKENSYAKSSTKTKNRLYVRCISLNIYSFLNRNRKLCCFIFITYHEMEFFCQERQMPTKEEIEIDEFVPFRISLTMLIAMINFYRLSIFSWKKGRILLIHYHGCSSHSEQISSDWQMLCVGAR